MSFPDCHFAPADCNDASAKMDVGTITHHKGKLYRYVQFKDAVAYAANQSVVYDDADAWAVTNDVSSSEDTTDIAAGVVSRVMTQNYYGFVLVSGLYSTVAKKAGVDSWTTDDIAVPSDDTDGVVNKLAIAVSSAGNPTVGELLVAAKLTLGALGTVAGASDDTGDTVPVLVNTL